MGEPPAHTRGDVQPVEKGLGQDDLMIGVRPGGPKSIGRTVGKLATKIAGRGVALVEEGRRPNLLSKAGQLHVGQTLDGLEKVVNPRLNQDIQTPIVPHLRQLGVGRRLHIASVFRLEEITDDLRIGLVLDCSLKGEIGAKSALMLEPGTLALVWNRQQ